MLASGKSPDRAGYVRNARLSSQPALAVCWRTTAKFSSILALILLSAILWPTGASAEIQAIKAKGRGFYVEELRPTCSTEMVATITPLQYEKITEDNLKAIISGVYGIKSKECKSIQYILLFLGQKPDVWYPIDADYPVFVKSEGNVLFSDLSYALDLLRHRYLASHKFEYMERILGLELKEVKDKETISRFGNRYVTTKKDGYEVVGVTPASAAAHGGFTDGDFLDDLPPLNPGTSYNVRVYTPWGYRTRKLFTPSDTQKDDFAAKRETLIANYRQAVSTVHVAEAQSKNSIIDLYDFNNEVEKGKRKIIFQNNDFIVTYKVDAGWQAKDCKNRKVFPVGKRRSEVTVFVIFSRVDPSAPPDMGRIFRDTLPAVRGECPEVSHVNFRVWAYPYAAMNVSNEGRRDQVFLDITSPEYESALIEFKVQNFYLGPIYRFYAYIYDGAHKLNKLPSTMRAEEFTVAKHTKHADDRSHLLEGESLTDSFKRRNAMFRNVLASVRAKKENARRIAELDRQVYQSSGPGIYDYGNAEYGLRIRMLMKGQIEALIHHERSQDFKSFYGSTTRSLIRHYAMTMGEEYDNCGRPTKTVDITWNNVTEYYNLYGGYVRPPSITKERYAGTFPLNFYQLMGADLHVYVNAYTAYIRKVIEGVGVCSERLFQLEKGMLAYVRASAR